MRKALFLLPALLLSLACATVTHVVYPPTPTVTSGPTLTFTPTYTPRASPRPSPTASATPNFTLTPGTPVSPTLTPIPPSPTPTPTDVPALGCKLNWQSPGNGITFGPRVDFTVGWNITNTGFQTWAADSVVLTYVSGSRMYRNLDSIPLVDPVGPGESTTVTAEMRSPLNSTKYTTYWSLRLGDVYFCPLRLNIYVE